MDKAAKSRQTSFFRLVKCIWQVGRKDSERARCHGGHPKSERMELLFRQRREKLVHGGSKMPFLLSFRILPPSRESAVWLAFRRRLRIGDSREGGTYFLAFCQSVAVSFAGGVSALFLDGCPVPCCCKYSVGVQCSNFLNVAKKVERLKPQVSEMATTVY